MQIEVSFILQTMSSGSRTRKHIKGCHLSSIPRVHDTVWVSVDGRTRQLQVLEVAWDLLNENRPTVDIIVAEVYNG